MRPKELIKAYVEAFNHCDADALANFYSETAINHQVANSPVEGRDAIRQMFVEEFSTANMSRSRQEFSW